MEQYTNTIAISNNTLTIAIWNNTQCNMEQCSNTITIWNRALMQQQYGTIH